MGEYRKRCKTLKEFNLEENKRGGPWRGTQGKGSDFIIFFCMVGKDRAY